MDETNPVERLDIAELQRRLQTGVFGRQERLVYFPAIDSTNTRAMQLALDGADEGVVVVTDNQYAGRGRQGRQWVDVAGCNSITSLVLRPRFAPYLLVMLAALAVVDAIHEVCDVSAGIKWPNDVLIAERKVAGILIETSRDHAGQMLAVMGIGVNVNAHPASQAHSSEETVALLNRATCLEEVCGHKVNREQFIASLLRFIETSYVALQDEATQTTAATHPGSRLPVSQEVRERWRSHLCMLGRTVEVRQGGTVLSGVAEDVNGSGELLLRLSDGTQISITWGEIGYPTL